MNPCDAAENVKDPDRCPRLQRRDLYDERLAARLAVMVSVAYLDPEKSLLSDAQAALDSETTGGMGDMDYQVAAINLISIPPAYLCARLMLISMMEQSRYILAIYAGAQARDSNENSRVNNRYHYTYVNACSKICLAKTNSKSTKENGIQRADYACKLYVITDYVSINH